MLPHRLLESEAYASLDLVGRALLQELVMLYKGDNNGSLWLSVRDFTARVGMSDHRPAMRAFTDVQDRGFATIAKEAHFEVKAADTSRARCWRLTWLEWAECPTRSKRAPTNEWEHYAAPAHSPARKRADRRLKALARYREGAATGRFPVVETTTLETQMPNNRAAQVVKTTTAIPANDANPPLTIVGHTPTHIDATMGGSLSVLGWWEPDWTEPIKRLAFFASVAESHRNQRKAAA